MTFPQHSPFDYQTQKPAVFPTEPLPMGKVAYSGPDVSELEEWYATLNEITAKTSVNDSDIDALEDLRDEIYRYLK